MYEQTFGQEVAQEEATWQVGAVIDAIMGFESRHWAEVDSGKARDHRREICTAITQ